MSAPVVAMLVVAVLFAVFGSFVAPVVPVMGAVPTAVGVPETVQVILWPGKTSLGEVGEQTVERPAGRPATAHVACVAVMRGAVPFEHMNVPL